MLRIAPRSIITFRFDEAYANRIYSTMNRPRNRQPRQHNNNQRQSQRAPSQTGNSNVPTSQEVIPGASVSIVLKADQPTGREVQGVVTDLLSRGDHPRGIKVRLQDGRIGRVQRIATAQSSAVGIPNPAQETFRPQSLNEQRNRFRDETPHSPEPAPRTLADFLPASVRDQQIVASPREEVHFASADIKCPICGLFEGDETAVSHHIQEHLS